MGNVGWMIVWAVVFVVALAVELVTTQMISAWFCGGALVSAVLAGFDVDFVIQIIVFVGVSTALLIVFKLFIEKRIKDRTPKTNYDALIGDEILITESVLPEKAGAGRFRDVTWTVVSDEPIPEGEFALVVERKGNKLVAKRKNAE